MAYYSIDQKNALNQPTRRKLYDIIEANPGIYQTEIKRKLGLNNGSILYHLPILIKLDLIRQGKEDPSNKTSTTHYFTCDYVRRSRKNLEELVEGNKA